MFRLIFTALIFLIGLPVYAQRFGGNPSNVKWQQVNNPVARIIYPQGLDSVAMKIAGIVQQLNTTTQSSIGNRQGKINIVLQNQTTASNGYVALGPFRSEFYLTPTQNSFTLGSLPWPVQLSIHEFRHVQQNNNFNVGLSKVLLNVAVLMNGQLHRPGQTAERKTVLRWRQVKTRSGKAPMQHTRLMQWFDSAVQY